jgi:hypothetical protein
VRNFDERVTARVLRQTYEAVLGKEGTDDLGNRARYSPHVIGSRYRGYPNLETVPKRRSSNE